MMSVLLSIRPKWCELIASGKKTIEVRKTRPRLETPFESYIYETLGKTKWISEYAAEEQNAAPFQMRTSEGRGKVIGEFVCDRIDKYSYDYCDGVDIDDDTILETAIDREDTNIYANGKTLYGWHISNLKIYDKPRELSEFATLCKENENRCANCGHYLFDNDSLNGYRRWCDVCHRKPLTRAPQSWCYVEAYK